MMAEDEFVDGMDALMVVAADSAADFFAIFYDANLLDLVSDVSKGKQNDLEI